MHTLIWAHHPVARVAFYLGFVGWLLLEWRTTLRSRLDRGGTRVDRRSFWLVYVGVAGGLVLAFFAARGVRAATLPGRWIWFGLGLALLVAGVVLRQWAILLLGRYFTVDVRVHDAQPVIDRGPYRWLRHPSYTGELVTLLGVGLALGNGLSVAAAVVPAAAALVVRIRVEERALLDGLGEPYRHFAATRARLLPGVW